MSNSNKINKSGKPSVTRTHEKTKVKDVDLLKKENTKRVEQEVLRKKLDEKSSNNERPRLVKPATTHTGEEGTEQFVAAARKTLKTLDNVAKNPELLAAENKAIGLATDAITSIEDAPTVEAKVTAASNAAKKIADTIAPQNPDSRLTGILALMLIMMQLSSKFWQLAQQLAESDIQIIVAGINKQQAEVKNQAWITLATGLVSAGLSVASATTSAVISAKAGTKTAKNILTKPSDSSVSLKQQSIQGAKNDPTTKVDPKLDNLKKIETDVRNKIPKYDGTELNKSSTEWNDVKNKQVEITQTKTQIESKEKAIETKTNELKELKKVNATQEGSELKDLDKLTELDNLQKSIDTDKTELTNLKNDLNTKENNLKELENKVPKHKAGDAKVDSEEYKDWQDAKTARQEYETDISNQENLITKKETEIENLKKELTSTTDTSKQNELKSKIDLAELELANQQSELAKLQKVEQEPLAGFWSNFKTIIKGDMPEDQIKALHHNSVEFQTRMNSVQIATQMTGSAFDFLKKGGEGAGDVWKSAQKSAELEGQKEAQEAGLKHQHNVQFRDAFNANIGAFKQSAQTIIQETSSTVREAARKL